MKFLFGSVALLAICKAGAASGRGCPLRVEVQGADKLQEESMGIYYLSGEFSSADEGGKSIYQSASGQNLRYSKVEKGWIVDSKFGDGKAALWSGTDSMCPSTAIDWQVFSHNAPDTGKGVWVRQEVTAMPLTDEKCPPTAAIVGGEKVHSLNPDATATTGVFKRLNMVAGAKHRGRPIYQNANGMQLYYWAEEERWILDTKPTSGDTRKPKTGVAFSSARRAGDTAECPQEAKEWTVWNAKNDEMDEFSSIEVSSAMPQANEGDLDKASGGDVDKSSADAKRMAAELNSDAILSVQAKTPGGAIGGTPLSPEVEASMAVLAGKEVGVGDFGGGEVSSPVREEDRRVGGPSSNHPKHQETADAWAMSWRAADAKAEAAEKAQRELRHKVEAVQQKKLMVAARLDRLKRRVERHKAHKANIIHYANLVEERNAKNYLKDAQRAAMARMAIKQEAMDRLQEKIEIERKAQAKIAAKQQLIKDQDDVLLAKLEKNQAEKDKLNKMVQMETQLARGVRESQSERLSDMNAKLEFDKRTDHSLTDKLAYESAQEKKLAVEMAKIVNHEQEVNQAKDAYTAKDNELKLVKEQLHGVKEELKEVKSKPCLTNKTNAANHQLKTELAMAKGLADANAKASAAFANSKSPEDSSGDGLSGAPVENVNMKMPEDKNNDGVYHWHGGLPPGNGEAMADLIGDGGSLPVPSLPGMALKLAKAISPLKTELAMNKGLAEATANAQEEFATNAADAVEDSNIEQKSQQPIDFGQRMPGDARMDGDAVVSLAQKGKSVTFLAKGQ